MAGVPRRVECADGSLFECDDDTGLDRWLDAHRPAGRAGRLLHAVEGRGALVAGIALLTVAVLAAGYRWGVPAATGAVVERLPIAALESLSDGAMDTIDAHWAEPSGLPEAERDAIGARFDALVAGLPDDGLDYRLHFRDIDGTPNAFALPNGEIVITDALVALAGGPDEVDAVLLHEIGHVRARHGLGTLLQSRAVSLAIALGTGAEGGFAELSATLANALLGAGYSRRAETEADAFAFDAMAALDRDPASFARIIRRLGGGGAEGAADEGRDDGTGDASALGWLASHPDSRARAREALRASERWRAGRATGEDG